MLTGERVWEQPWPEADLALLERDVGRGRRAGQRQAARPHPGAGDRHARGARGAGARAPERAGAHRRQAGREGRSSCRPSSSTSSCAERGAARCSSRRFASHEFGTDRATDTVEHVTPRRLGSAACPNATPASSPPGPRPRSSSLLLAAWYLARSRRGGAAAAAAVAAVAAAGDRRRRRRAGGAARVVVDVAGAVTQPGRLPAARRRPRGGRAAARGRRHAAGPT